MEHLYPPVGGAERSMDTMLRGLQSRGFETRYVCKTNINERSFDEIAQADVVLTQLSWAPRVIQATRAAGKKSVFFFRSMEALCRVADNPFVLSYCGQACAGCPFRGGLPAQPDVIVANSKFSQRLLAEQFGLPSEVIYPPLEVDQLIAPKRVRRWITMNQRALHKGADVFGRIAAAMPDLEFRIIGYEDGLQYSTPQNLTLSGPLSPAEFLSDTLVFLAPARWKETFGRTLVEFRMNGIPVIASRRGGAVDDALVPAHLLIDDVDDIGAWVRTIRGVLADYDSESARAGSLDVTPYTAERGVTQLARLIERLQEQHG